MDFEKDVLKEQEAYKKAYQAVYASLKSKAYDNWVFCDSTREKRYFINYALLLHLPVTQSFASYTVNDNCGYIPIPDYSGIYQEVCNLPDRTLPLAFFYQIIFNTENKVELYDGYGNKPSKDNLADKNTAITVTWITQNIIQAIDTPYWILMGKLHPIWIRKSLSIPQRFEKMEKAFNLHVYGVEEKQDQEQEAPTEEPEVQAEKKSEDFIKNLRLCHENNFTIKIYEPNGKIGTYTFDSLGFRDKRTREGHPDKTWEIFIKILQNSNHTYCVGKAYTHSAGIKQPVKGYDAKRKLLTSINKKLITFFNSQYSLLPSDNFNLYELCPNKPPGTYRFKFQIGDEVTTQTELYSGFTKNQIEREIKKLSNDDREAPEKLIAAVSYAKKQLGMTDDKLQEILPWQPPKEEIRYDPNENKDLESAY